MRTAFIKTLFEAAEDHQNVWLLTGDLGYGVLEEFAAQFPNRYVNMGVAEQNMAGVAAGLALCGKTVFTYSIANFPIMRCLEQIRNDICYHNADVKIVAVGGGFAYGTHGYTHHALEDLAVMRAMPNMTVIAPGDPIETRLATRAIINQPGPCYLRLGKAGEPAVYEQPPQFEIGKAIIVSGGSDVTLISTGGMLRATVEAGKLLAAEGISSRVLSMHTLSPLDKEAVQAAALETKLIATIEEHAEVGGLYSAVAEALPHGASPLLRFAVPNELRFGIGTQNYLTALAGLSPSAIAKAVTKQIR